ncbi:MAG: hypothetical protein [Caudoviricetes sp.]|nr:MAG: hypothetical protein [Caudoviricetes sp.]
MNYIIEILDRDNILMKTLKGKDKNDVIQRFKDWKIYQRNTFPNAKTPIFRKAYLIEPHISNIFEPEE